jgi:hypothetical protein
MLYRVHPSLPLLDPRHAGCCPRQTRSRFNRRKEDVGETVWRNAPTPGGAGKRRPTEAERGRSGFR